jgi:aspartate/methionine/tyrosine aminotransferase
MSKMLEVCSTTLPQYVLPEIYENKEFYTYTRQRIEKYKQRADIAQDIFSKVDKVRVIKPK